MATICRYYQRGSCNYGNQCRFLHPGQPSQGAGGFPASGGAEGSGNGAQTQSKLMNFTLPSTEALKQDLTELPNWILSSYGPGKDPPVQLIDGKDISFEEARLMFYVNPQATEQEMNRRHAEAQQQIQNILNNIPGALDYLKQAQQNRAQVYQYNTPGSSPTAQQLPQTSNPFGAPSQAQSTTVSPFGQPSQPQSAFGQASQLNSAFGASTSGAAPSPFASAATAGPKPAFGQPAFGQTSSPFAASAAAPKPAFGQPAFGQTSSPFAAAAQQQQQQQQQQAAGPGPFGQQQQQQPSSVFGSTSALGTSIPKPAFGQSGFAQPAFGQTSSPFAAAAQQQPQQQQPANSPFATAMSQPQQQVSAPATSTANPFQQTATSGPSPFAAAASQPSPFTTTASQPTPFTSQAPVNPSPFATSAAPSATSAGNPFAVSSAPSAPSADNPFARPTTPPKPAAPAFSSTTPTQAPNPFGTAQTPTTSTQGFGANAAARASPAPGAGTSGPHPGTNKWDDPIIEYTEEELAAFRADSFEIGKVPMVAPPMELCL